jgi:hypothetical protein
MKKPGIVLVLLCVTYPILLKAGGIENGFKALSVYDYFKAKIVFTKEVKSKNDYAAATYGLSILA